MKIDLAVTQMRSAPSLPALIADAGKRSALRFVEFFAVNVRNKNTRKAYGRCRCVPALARRAGD
jgi:hypothetical protein